MTSSQDNLELRLSQANQRLAELLDTGPLKLDTGGQSAARDAHWIWGIVGGKDVGKTTLINALAGADVVSPGQDVGQGTFRPAAYLAVADVEATQARLGDLSTHPIQYHAQAPERMAGLVLLDLPDFDSLFTEHADQVHRIVTLLDGIIWVTTPQKVGDLRAIREIAGILKSRSNFIYVVNKMDWLIAQADPAAGPLQTDLDRLRSALQHQIDQVNPNSGPNRTFMISAKYPQSDDLLNAVKSHTNNIRAVPAVAVNGQLAQTARHVAEQFQALLAALTTAPTPDLADHNKQANLTYQVRRQAQALLDHHQPQPLLDRIEQRAGPDRLAEIVEHSFDAAYCGEVFERLNAGSDLTAQWSSALFKARILHWPLLGFIAWPASALGSALRALGAFLPGANRTDRDHAFRAAGITAQDRADALLDRLQADLGAVTSRVTLEWPDAARLAAGFRQDATTLANRQRALIIDPLLNRKPGWVGQAVRTLLTLAVLLWFPLIQPLLAVLLPMVADGNPFNAQSAAYLATTLSGTTVLTGLAASLLILAAIVAAIYARAVKHAHLASDTLRRLGPIAFGELLTQTMVAELNRPLNKIRAELGEVTDSLKDLSDPAQH